MKLIRMRGSMLSRFWGIATAMTLHGCGADVDASASQPTGAVQEVSEALPFDGAGSSDDGLPGVFTEEVDGVLIFWHREEAHDDAVLTASPAIQDTCLRMGQHVVVWHESRLTQARDLANAAVGSAAIELIQVGGGEALATSSALTDQCADSPLWFTSPIDQ